MIFNNIIILSRPTSAGYSDILQSFVLFPIPSLSLSPSIHPPINPRSEENIIEVPIYLFFRYVSNIRLVFLSDNFFFFCFISSSVNWIIQFFFFSSFSPLTSNTTVYSCNNTYSILTTLKYNAYIRICYLMNRICKQLVLYKHNDIYLP